MSLQGLSKYLSSVDKIKNIAQSLQKAKEKTVISGIQESGKTAILSSIIFLNKSPVLIITPRHEDAENICNDLKLLLDRDVFFFPEHDTGQIGERLEILNKLISKENIIVVAPVKAAISRTIPPELLKKSKFGLKKNNKISLRTVCKRLIELEYKRVDIVGDMGEFSIRGGILDIFPPDAKNPIRADFLGDSIETLKEFDIHSQRSVAEIDSVSILPSREVFSKGFSTVADYFELSHLVILDDEIQIKLTIRNLIEKSDVDQKQYQRLETSIRNKQVLEISGLSEGEGFNLKPIQPYFFDQNKMTEDIRANIGVTLIVSKQAKRIIELLAENNIDAALIHDLKILPQSGTIITHGDFSKGFNWPDEKLVVLTDKEIFGESFVRGVFKAVPSVGINRSLLIEITEGDFVVHGNHGIGIYKGLERLSIGGFEQEYILIEYAEQDKLYVPLSQMGLVEKYSSSGEFVPKINRLGGKQWTNTKKKAMKALEDLASDLLDINAVRENTKGYAYPADSVWQSELSAGFPFEETEDQSKAINHVYADMESEKPMDRLVCGDVGYGKTEVALRAAFKAAAAGKQVAILVPTTILAEQHYNNFKQRFAPFPVNIEMLSRFRSKKEQAEIIQKVSTHEVDVIIGTHRIIQKDIKFKDLGLIIIDEEQRFGVAHKEKLKKLRKIVDVLTLTATPIPRTLYLSLSGARDMSMIGTPPLDRSPIQTVVTLWNKQIVKEAILRELERGGQVFYVYNHVTDIEKTAEIIRKLIPAARIAIAHGQMAEGMLEKTMLDFMARKFDILLCTTIIESGIDIPNVNTIIIDGANRFGLAQLYQLRGRVGRSSAHAYSYLLYHKNEILSSTSIERLKAIKEFTSLGSGYRLALRDLEIRGAGNLLGREQHGHMVAMGFDLYCDMMEKAVAKAKGIDEVSSKDIQVDIKEDAYIPSDYISDERQRIAFYRRLNLLNNQDEVADIKNEVEDRFGKIPDKMAKMLKIIEVKVNAKAAGIKSIKELKNTVNIEFFDKSKENIIVKLDKGGEKHKLKMLFDLTGKMQS